LTPWNISLPNQRPLRALGEEANGQRRSIVHVTEPEEIVIRRFLPAPRERVFAAWLDPLSLARWMHPGGEATATAEVDARVGGRFRIVMKHSGGVTEHSGEYLVIERPARLSFTWISEHTHQIPTQVTVECFERDQGTELVLTHRRLPASKIEGHRRGWTTILQNLERVLGA
jgi:uncharacterized protein YndB with AHSA1/START domain